MSTFTNSCAPINLPCSVGDQYINPCDCRGYFECKVGGYDFLDRRCSPGTAWNHNTGFCDAQDKIFIADGTPICARDEPWLRCDFVQGHYREERLENLCDPDEASGGGNSGGGSDDTAAIVGGIVGGLLVVLLLALFIYWWNRRSGEKSRKSNFPFRPSIQQPSKEMEEEVYDVIDEKSVTPSNAVTNVTYGNDTKMEYDNPSFRDKTDPDNNYLNVKQQQQQQQQQQQPQYNYQQQIQHQQHLHGPTTSFNQPSSLLYPGSFNSQQSGRSTGPSSDDLSRSISIGGQDIVVEDAHGYHVGYPSGTIPRHPSPLPYPDHDEDDVGDDGADPGYGYHLATAHVSNDYTELEKTNL